MADTRVGVLALAALLAHGQMPTAQITGRVTDASGAVIPSTLVTVTNIDTGVSRSAPTNEQGLYTAALLDPGRYRVSVGKEGFRTVTREGVTLHINDNLRLDFALEVGAVADSVEVRAEVPLVQSESAAMGTVVDNKRIVNLPLNSRNPFSLTALTPGVIPSSQFGDEFNNSNAFRINGGRSNMSEILIDGVTNALPGANQFLVNATLPSVDALEEFKVQTNSFSAEYGRTGGGVVNMVLKSGTNAYHGSAYEFLRNSTMDANNFFSNRAGRDLPSFQRNQFGATVGGPIAKNRAFFFASYEGLRQRSAAVSTGTTPTDRERVGDFSRSADIVAGACTPLSIFDPSTTRRNAAGTGFVRDPFPGAVIPTNRLDGAGAKLIGYYPLPNTTGAACNGVNNFLSQKKTVLDTTQVDTRADWSPTPNDKLFGSVSWRERGSTAPNHFGNIAGGGSRTSDPGRGVRLDYTRVESPTLILNLRFGISRFNRTVPPAAPPDFQLTELGFPRSLQEQMSRPYVFPNMSVTGFLGTGTTFAKVDQAFTTYSWYANATKLRGRHTLKFGTEVRVNQVFAENLDSTQGLLSFGRNFTQGPDPNAPRVDRGSGAASLLLGLGSGLVKIKPGVLTSNNYYGLFLQDDIRATSKLTLNLGLRYDYENGRDERFNRLSWFDFDAPSPLAARLPQFPNLHGGLRFVGVDADRQFDLDPNNIAPRFGIAYTIHPKLVVRAGYGLYYMAFLGGATGDAAAINGFLATTEWLSSIDGLTPANPLSNPFPNGLTKPTGSTQGLASSLGQALGVAGQVYGGDGAIDRGSRVAYQQHWNLNLQFQLRDIGIETAYIGSKGTKLLDQGWEMNQLTADQLRLGTALQDVVANPFAGIIPEGPLSTATVRRSQLIRPFPHFTGLLDFRPGAASSTYHAFQMSANKRFSSGATFLVSYTTGKLIDDSSGIGPAGPSPLHQDTYNRRASRSVSPQDVSQRLVLSYVCELPLGRAKRLGAGVPAWTNWIIGGWQINGITTFSTGLPLAITTPNNSQAFNSVQRPNVNGNPALPGGRSTDEKLSRWFDTSVFTQTAPFTFGNLGRVLPNVRSDGIKNFDFSLFKEFPFLETRRVEFRAEAFNVFNTPQFGSPGLSLGTGTFGVVAAQANSPRQIQLGLKLVF